MAFLADGGEQGARLRAHGWSDSPLGPPGDWPEALRSAVALVLRSRFPMFVLWGEARVLLYNDSYVPILGSKHPVPVGSGFFEVWPEVRPYIEPIVDRAYAGEASWFEDLPIVLERPEPEHVWFTFSYSPIINAAGDINGVLCVCTETTQKVMLEHRRAFLLSLTERMHDADPVEGPVVAAQLLGEHLGAARAGYAEVDDAQALLSVARDWTSGIVPSLAGEARPLDAFGSAIAAELRAGRTVRVDDCLADPRVEPADAATWQSIGTRAVIAAPMVKGGRLRAILYVHEPSPRRWSDAEVALVETVAVRTREAVERAEAEDALRRLNESLEALVAERTEERDRMWRLSRDLLVVIGRRWTILAVNPAVTKLLGYAPEETTGKRFSAFVHPEDLAAAARSIRSAATAPVGDFEARLRAKDGSWRWFSWSVAPGQGEAYVVGRDVTQERRRREELEEARDALRQAQKMESLGQLTGGVAHDFNNLLSPIVGSLDLLQRRGVSDERVRRLLDAALQSAERAKTLVRRLLAFARRQPLQSTAVDVARLLDGLTELLASTLGPQIKMVLRVAPDLPPARADPNQLEMALLNLAVNARDAMPDGGMLTISAEARPVGHRNRNKLVPGDYVHLSVVDTGTGMDEATLERAVEPFFSTKGMGKGTGLGLSMVHGLAAQLGGALTLSSAPGIGTDVGLWIPVAGDAPALATAPPEPALPAVSRGAVLLVDDEELVRASTAEMLSDLGYSVIEAESAARALELIEAGLAFDLLVTDHLMPGMTGTALVNAIREHRSDLPVLVISGYAEVDSIAPELPRLAKPFRQHELAAKLAQIA